VQGVQSLFCSVQQQARTRAKCSAPENGTKPPVAAEYNVRLNPAEGPLASPSAPRLRVWRAKGQVLFYSFFLYGAVLSVQGTRAGSGVCKWRARPGRVVVARARNLLSRYAWRTGSGEPARTCSCV